MTLDPKKLRKSVAVEVGGRSMVFEAGWLAKQAAGAVLVRYDNSAVLTTCQNAEPRGFLGFFPMTVEYKEKTGAAGKIPGGFFKREGRPTTKEVLTCRMIDRPLRPLFADGYMQEVQIISQVFSADQAHDPDVCGMNGASLSVLLAGLPFAGPVGSVRVALVNDELVINPTYEELEECVLELLVAGTQDAIVMVEAGAQEVSEDVVIEGLSFAHECIKDICKAQIELAKLMGAKPIDWTAPEKADAALLKECEAFYKPFRDAVKTQGKFERKDAIKAAKNAAFEALLKDPGEDASKEDQAAYAKRAGFVKDTISSYAYKAIRDTIVEENVRIDGRQTDEIRDIVCEVAPFPRNHGSAIFTRGETQAFVNCTLGTAQDTQRVDGLTETREESFLLHYNFPPFCTGEAKPLRGTSRREQGHGNLAHRALAPMVPDPAEFPYTIRVVSDILESNGSSSMASVCGGTLSMMDAGVPLKSPVAGIAMGMIKEGDTVRVLSDILGDEDHCGDMDFKVCGTAKGITALQMDIKVAGLSSEIMKQALDQAKAGRKHILAEMAKGLDAPREEISKYAPRYEVCKVPVDKIGMVIGPGGKMIRGLQEEFGCTISIEDDGTVKIFAEEGVAALEAKQRIVDMTEDVEVGTYFDGTISSIKDFGVFADIKPGAEGMCHVSEMSDQYVGDPNEICKVGDVMKFKVIHVEQGSGKVKLSHKAVILEERGEEYTYNPPQRSGGGRGGPRGGGGGGRGGPRR